MTTPAADPREEILRQCARASPRPWYPREYAQETGTDRDRLDPPLEELRMGGLIQLTEWVEGLGQGYQLTEAGERFVRDERGLGRLRAGGRVEPPRREALPAERADSRSTAWDRGEAVRESLLGQAPPRVTMVILAVNLLVFGYQLYLTRQLNAKWPTFMGLDGRVLHQSGAITAADIVAGDWWRLLSCCFVHIGWGHLAVNMYMLFALGPLLERMWGPVRFLVLYLLSGLVGSCTMVLVTPNVLGAGASGALWGMMVSFAVWLVLNKAHLPPTLVSAWLRRMVTVLLLNVFISLAPGISAAAHFGGGGAGLLASVLLHYQRFGGALARLASAAGLVLVAVLSVGVVAAAPLYDARWREIQGQEDRREFNRRLRESDRALDEARKAYREQAAPLIERHPTRRDAAGAARAADGLREQRVRLNEILEEYRALRPYRTPLAERARQALMEYLQEEARFLELGEECLRQGEGWTRQQDQEFVEQERRTQSARRRLAAALRGEGED